VSRIPDDLDPRTLRFCADLRIRQAEIEEERFYYGYARLERREAAALRRLATRIERRRSRGAL
jgi:hypothetical protein